MTDVIAMLSDCFYVTVQYRIHLQELFIVSFAAVWLHVVIIVSNCFYFYLYLILHCIKHLKGISHSSK